MERLEEIDQQLEALGKPLADMRAALESVLGQDRSLAKIDELLTGLGDLPPRAPSSLPPRRGSGRPSAARSTLVSMAPAPAPAPAPEPAPAPAPAPEPAPALTSSWPPRAARSSLPPRIVTPFPPLSSPVPAVASPSPWPPLPLPRITDTLVDTPLVPLPPIGPSEEDLDAETAALLGDIDPLPAMPSAVPLPFGPSVEMSPTPAETPTRVGPPPAEIEAAAEAQQAQQARERRDSVRALLDQEIDPSDFPSARPPKGDDDDGMEMLLEDEEILEIEDDELLEDEEGG